MRKTASQIADEVLIKVANALEPLESPLSMHQDAEYVRNAYQQGGHDVSDFDMEDMQLSQDGENDWVLEQAQQKYPNLHRAALGTAGPEARSLSVIEEMNRMGGHGV
jgi:hypothetical protein